MWDLVSIKGLGAHLSLCVSQGPAVSCGSSFPLGPSVHMGPDVLLRFDVQLGTKYSPGDWCPAED